MPTPVDSRHDCLRRFRAAGLWHIVDGKQSAPVLASSATGADLIAEDAWLIKVDRAAGTLALSVEEEQCIHFNGIDDDPVKMWKALQDVFVQRCPGTHFDAYDNLFSIQKKEGESLQSLMNHVDEAIHCIKELHDKDFTLAKLDDELNCMALICALSEEYQSFVSSLHLMEKLDKDAVKLAFVAEESHRNHRAATAAAVGTALSASTSLPSHPVHCTFCGQTGHVIEKCYAYADASAKAKDRAKNKGKVKANKAQEVPDDKKEVVEFAGNASVLFTFDPSNPSTPLQMDADFDWVADTGATSHMTSHCHWIPNYASLCIPVKLADNSIIYSARVGTVVFNPVVNGKKV
ncbi:unnamed protein product [Cyclocybe aegerita]|uniref:Retrovirus-related Pol polyprotein from transposon TNT 1-94-like beta-barrel domain-containing protein n=1 Tax=Cyclocybe aegerita TaxID=1973307 RepID=A0A8S0WWL3_CYCAE|nr:unnamed protein product [Cyclocybe aegerita]